MYVSVTVSHRDVCVPGRSSTSHSEAGGSESLRPATPGTGEGLV